MLRDMPSSMPLLVFLACLGTASAALADNPDTFDPMLDTPPTTADRPDNQYRPPDLRSPGFMIGAHLGIYAGAIKSRLTTERSTLDSGARPFYGFGFGVRTRSPIEIGVDLGLGHGRTWSPKFNIDLTAYDIIVQPRVLAHVYESEYIGIYTGLAGEAILFDVGTDGLNQAGIGPAGVFGILHRLGPHSLIFAEITATAFYDFLAYRFEAPSAETLEMDPTAEPEKIEGEWYGIFRFTVGYRLTGF